MVACYPMVISLENTSQVLKKDVRCLYVPPIASLPWQISCVVNLYTALGALKIGLDILLKQEGVKLDEILGHGGLFKTKGVGQKIMAAAINVPVSVMETAGEGGAWGIALLASYMINKSENETLEAFLSQKIFAGKMGITIAPDAKDVAGFEEFMKRYVKGLAIERAADRSFEIRSNESYREECNLKRF